MNARKIPALAAAAMALLASTAAMAAGDIPGGTTTKATLPIQVVPSAGNWESVGDSDWYRVSLRKGETYAFTLDERGDAATFEVAVRNAAGKVLKKAIGDLYTVAGIEFVPPTSGTYFLDARLVSFDSGANGGYLAAVGPDCLAGAKTTCQLQPGKQQRRNLAFFRDADWFKVSMQAGKAYTFVADNVDDVLSDMVVEVVDAAGKVLATGATDGSRSVVTGFKPPKAGTYYARVRDLGLEAIGPYTIVLQQAGPVSSIILQ